MASVKYLNVYRDRHGKLRHAFRRRGYKTVQLHGEPGSVEFMQAYTDALAGATEAPRSEFLRGHAVTMKIKPGSVSAAVTLYLGSMDFGRLAEATRGDRRRDLERFRADYGEQSFAALDRGIVERLLAKKVATPHAAKNFLKALRSVVAVALRAGICETDSTAGIKVKARTSPQGFQSWAECDIEQFEAVYPIGSRERLAFGLLLYTGQRRGDVIRMGRQHIRDGVLTARQAKTGAVVEIPIHAELQAILGASEANHQSPDLPDDSGGQALHRLPLHQLVRRRVPVRRASDRPIRPWPS